MAEITAKQHRAVVALVSCPTVTEAATVADVAERTLYRWLSDPAFRSHMSEVEGQAIDAATRRLLGMQEAAIEIINGIMSSPETPPAVRLRAAATVIDYMLRMRDLT
jgi:phage terminase small subunit